MKTLRYHENKPRGSQEFPLDYHFVSKEHPRYEMPYHWHEETEIIHVVSGQFALMMDGSRRTLQSGALVYIAPGCLHGGEPQDCVYECVVFDMRFLLKAAVPGVSFVQDVLSRRVDISPFLTEKYTWASRCLLPMFNALGERLEGSDLVALGALLQFFGEAVGRSAFSRHTRIPDQESRGVLKLKRVFELIESRPGDPPSIEEMSAVIGMTPKYFNSFFKQATHSTPAQYIGFYRIEQACYEMLATDKNVTEIAMDLGYCDLSHFIRCFKRYKGVSPGEYLKTIRPEGG